MERLTENVLGNIQLKACGNDFCKETCAEHGEEKSCNNCPIQKAFEKLAEYEDFEEQGKLIRLPCAVGDTVYCIYNKYQECDTKNEYCIQPEKAQSLDWIVEQEKHKRFGKTVFLTQPEAERMLAEAEGKK